MTSLRITYHILCLLVCAMMLVSCSPTADQPETENDGQITNEEAAKPSANGKVQWIDPNKIQPGPIRHDKLSDKQIARIKSLQKTFFEIDGQSVDQWVDSFKRDLNLDRELAIWERIAKAYNSYCSQRKLTLDAKKEVYKVVLLRSMASQEDVLQKIDFKVITKDEAIEVMKGF